MHGMLFTRSWEIDGTCRVNCLIGPLFVLTNVRIGFSNPFMMAGSFKWNLGGLGIDRAS